MRQSSDAPRTEPGTVRQPEAAPYGKVATATTWISERVVSSRRARGLSQASISLLILAVPLWTVTNFELDRYKLSLLYVIVAIGLNLVFGYSGEIVLSSAVVMGIGAYGAGILGVQFGLNFIVSVGLATLVGTIVGLLILVPGLRVHGFYFGLVTLFVVFVLPDLVLIGAKYTGGPDGLTGINPMAVAGFILPPWLIYEVIAVVAICSWCVSRNLLASSWGLRFRALRDAPRAADAAGVGVAATRLVGYVVSSAMAALAGGLLAYNEQFVNPGGFGVAITLLFLTGVVLGGKGTLWGPVVGMIPLLYFNFWVGQFSSYNPIVFGVVLLVILLLFPRGVVSGWLALWRRWVRRCGNSSQDAEQPTRARVSTAATENTAAVSVRIQPEAADGLKPLLSIRGVQVVFGGVAALDGVDMDLIGGRVVGLVGANGSGKSTLLNVVTGFVKPISGTVRIGDEDVTGKAAKNIARQGVGRTFQIPQLIPELSSASNIELGLLGSDPGRIVGSILRTSAVRRDEAQRRNRVELAWSRLGLTQRLLDEPVSALSLGTKRIVEIGRAIVGNPLIILLDEPGAGLNEVERDRVGSLVRELADFGIGVLVVEHNVGFVMKYCDELTLLDSGKVVARADLRTGAELPDELASHLRYTETQVAPTDQPHAERS